VPDPTASESSIPTSASEPEPGGAARLLGTLRLVQRGGKDLFVYDRALVQVWTGLGTALQRVATDGTAAGFLGGAGAARVTRAVGKQVGERGVNRLAELPPEVLVEQNKGNRLIWFDKVVSARIPKHHWYANHLRRLELTLRDEQTVTFRYGVRGRNQSSKGWADPASCEALLRQALGERLEVAG
jgi:hypothetical protein